MGAFSGTELTISKTMAVDTYRTKVAADDAEAEKIWIRQLKQHTEFGPSMVLQGDWQVLYLEN